jgi:thiamine-phosphate pyrophosphorylase
MFKNGTSNLFRNCEGNSSYAIGLKRFCIPKPPDTARFSPWHHLYFFSIKMEKTSQNESDRKNVFRVLDANLNRLREALRVVEEYFRFIAPQVPIAEQLKKLRHDLQELEQGFGPGRLLAGRDTETDPFANVNRPEEMDRQTIREVLVANFKRGQEACRVIEEYSKITDAAFLSEKAKTMRFSLYSIEKPVMEKALHG